MKINFKNQKTRKVFFYSDLKKVDKNNWKDLIHTKSILV